MSPSVMDSDTADINEPAKPIVARTWRKVFLSNREPGMTIGWLEDENHHFGVTLIHKDGIVQEVRGSAPRFPWATCGQAPQAMTALEGKPLITRTADFGGQVTMRQQCTHVFELAGLVSVHAAKAREDYLYEADVTTENPSLERVPRRLPNPKPCTARLKLNGRQILDFTVDNRVITGPEAFAGLPLEDGFRAWTERLPEDEAEAALILRRAVWLHSSWWSNLDVWDNAESFTQDAACYTFQPERRPVATRNVGAKRDYTNTGDTMLAHRDKTPGTEGLQGLDLPATGKNS